jgi:hypothetical protein
MQRLDSDDFDFLHSWIWDRTRAVRKDLRTQRIEAKSDINILLTCLERSARFFLLSAHQMARTKKDDYSHQQDIEQLNQTFMSLNERYKDNERINLPSENESEFYAYRLILAPLFNESQFENDLHTLRPDLRNNPRVKSAVEIYRAIRATIFDKNKAFASAQGNWKRLWDMIKSPRVSYLMACAAEIAFERVRHNIIDTIWHAYRYGNVSNPQTVITWTVPNLRNALGYDKDSEAVQLCEAYGFEFRSVDGGPVFLDVSKKGFQKTSLPPLQDGKPQVFSQGMVEQKRKDRAFSAIVQAMSVQEAKRRSLMSDSSSDDTNNEETSGETEDETSLFIPEAPAAKTNVFMQPKSTLGNPATTNPFLQKTTPNIGSVAVKPNPFTPPQVSISGPGITKPNAFLPQASQSPFGQAGAGLATTGPQPGLFNPAKDSVKFAPSDGASTPFGTPFGTAFGGASKPNDFGSTSASTPASPAASATSGSLSQGFTSTTPAAASTPPLPAFTPPTANKNTFVFPGLDERAVKPPSATPSFSFTPAGSPAPTHSGQDTEKQKADEEAARRKAEADVEAQRQREQQEQARRAEQQRIEAERQQQRLQEEERNRQLREAQEIKQREEEARMARVRARESGYDALAADIMFDVNEGLMMQFVENLIQTTASQAMAADQEEKRKKVREKQEVVADAMYEQRTMALLHRCMFKLVARNEKKKRDQKARDRRKRLKEQKAKMMVMEVAPSDMPVSAVSDIEVVELDKGATFRKPQAPASARRAKRTEERRGTASVPQNGASSLVAPLGPPAQQQAAQAVLTPVSMNDSQGSNASYSESYRKSTAPIDRTNTDWFTLRAEGFDPSALRKRNFDAAADEEQQDTETKRPKMEASATTEPPMPQTSTTSDRRARLEALEQKFRKSTGSPQLTDGASSFNGRSSLDKRSSILIEQARQVLGRSRSTKASSPSMQHNYGRSVPSLHRRTMSAQPSVLGRSIGATQDRPAYWNRPSRFVPKSCYGQGPGAIRDYRIKYGLSSPVNTRPNSTEPLAVSSPIPTQMSYMPINGYTQEQYSEAEESSGIEIVDVDAEDTSNAPGEDEDVGTTEEEYEGDEESDDGQCEVHHSKTHPVQVYDQDDYDEEGDSPMQDGFTNDDYVTGQYADEALVDYEGYSDEDADSDEESEEEDQFNQRTMPHFHSANAKKPPPPPIGGNTEDDAIELSD